jgi:hypothetical protein
VNSKTAAGGAGVPVHGIDAERIAREAGLPQGVNLLLLGFLLSRLGSIGDGGRFFCSGDDLREALEKRFARKPRALEESLEALALGVRHGKE